MSTINSSETAEFTSIYNAWATRSIYNLGKSFNSQVGASHNSPQNCLLK
jgi:hypothetical protein